MSTATTTPSRNTAMQIDGRVAPARAVVVHSGARDNYQVARALHEAGLLEALVTDLYWPAEKPWARAIASALPTGLRMQLRSRTAGVPLASCVQTLAARGLAMLLMEHARFAPFAWRRALMRSSDAALGSAAGRLARDNKAILLAYSYYGYDAFHAYGAPGILFQLHPHPASMRAILQAELQAYPDCAASLCREWELALPEEDFARLVAETATAERILAASSFTRKTLLEHGTPANNITVLPYGVDCERFSPGSDCHGSGKLQLLFVGRMNQRKGIKYLLEALRMLGRTDVQLTVCGRVVDDLSLFRPFAGQITIRPSVTEQELLAAYRAADLFVLPSVGEGFGQVLLESLACGLPVLSTTHTAAPDLVHDGEEGFIVPPRSATLLAERIEWAATHRPALAAMRIAARNRARYFTWERFRAGIVDAVRSYKPQAAGARSYV